MGKAISILALLLATAFAHAQQYPPGNPRDALTWYRRAFEKYQSLNFGDAEWLALGNFEGDPGRGPSESARSAINRFQPVLQMVQRGAQLTECGNAYDFSNGPSTDYADIANSRRLCLLLRYDLALRMYEGDAATAADRIITVHQLGKHQSNDGRLIGALVSNAMFHLGEGMTKTLIDHGLLGSAEAARILDAVNTIDQNDKFGFEQAIQNEKSLIDNWMTEQFTGEGGLERLAQHSHLVVGFPPHSSEDEMSALALANMSEEAVAESLADSSRYMGQIAEIFANPDRAQAKADLEALHSKMKEGGPLVHLLVGRGLYMKAFQMRALSEKKLEAHKALLQGFIDGTTDLKSLANAAIWYMQAIVAIERSDQGLFERVRLYAIKPDAPPDDALKATLSSPEMQSVINTLREASNIERCEFEYTGETWISLSGHHPGMYDAARLLTADTARLLHEQAPDAAGAAMDRIAIALRMASHLAKDKTLISSAIAQDLLKTMDSLLQRAVSQRRVTAAHRELLQLAAAQLRAADPLGYGPALAANREHAQQHLGYAIRTDEEEVVQAKNALVRQLDPDRLLWLSIISVRSMYWEHSPRQEIDAQMKNLAGMIDMDALRQTIAQAHDVRKMLTRAQTDEVLTMPFPQIASIEARMRRADEIVRSLLAQLEEAQRSSALTSPTLTE